MKSWFLIFCISAAELPFYTCLTAFRVLPMSYAVTSLGYKSLPIYGVLVLGIVIIGYMKTSKEEDFVVRGFRSVITTGRNVLNLVSCFKLFSTS